MMKLFMAGLCLILGLSFATAPLTVSAADTGAGSGYDISWIGGEGNGAFDRAEESVKATGNSAYKLVMSIAVVGLLICAVICGISIAVSGGNGNKRGEKLGWLAWIALGGCVVFGATTLIGLFQSIGTNMF